MSTEVNDSSPDILNDPAPEEGAEGIGRRDALKKMGKYAAYTAPMMMVLMTPRAHAGPPGQGGTGPGVIVSL